MMRKYIFCTIALFALTASVFAQKSKKFDQSMIKSKSDSLSYALGQSITRGLKQHLAGSGVLKDTTAQSLIENYDAKFAKADEAGKAALKKEYEKKLKETVAANELGLRSFQKGLEEAVVNIDPSKNAYFTGVGIGSQLLVVGERFEEEMIPDGKINKDAFLASILSSLAEEKSLIDNAEEFLQSVAMQKQEAENIGKAEELKATHGERISEGVKFLAENKAKEGVVALPSGLQYTIVEEGDGVKPLSTDNVTVHYEGRLLDGTVFDSSYKRGEPATFGVTQVIKGWTEILQMMPVGSKWTVYIPSDMAYGDRDMGTIKPYSTLVFDIELLDVAK